MVRTILKYRNLLITLGALVCFVEFLSIGRVPSPGLERTVGVLHLVASAYLMLALVLYITTWRMAWVLLLRVLFAGFILLMIGYAIKQGLQWL
ncbi:MAG TPA: hypothetical protein PKW06_05915 [Cyclobacteriaceae bacterium]|nr:hypothetical protein [Cyclobacteriaceae bacterium]